MRLYSIEYQYKNGLSVIRGQLRAWNANDAAKRAIDFELITLDELLSTKIINKGIL
jgi:hypothetical protein